MKLMKIFGLTAVMLLMPFVSKAEMDSTAEVIPTMQEMEENLAMLNELYSAIGTYNVYDLDEETLTVVNEAFQNDIGHYDNKQENYAAISKTDTFKLYLGLGAIGQMMSELSEREISMMNMASMPESIQNYMRTVLSAVLTSQASVEDRFKLASLSGITLMYWDMKEKFQDDSKRLEDTTNLFFNTLSTAINEKANVQDAEDRRRQVIQYLCREFEANEEFIYNIFSARKVEHADCKILVKEMLTGLSEVTAVALYAAMGE